LYFNETGKQVGSREVDDSVVGIPAKEMSVDEIQKIILEHPAWFKNAEKVMAKIDAAIAAEKVRKAEAAEQERRRQERLELLQSKDITDTGSLISYTGELGREYAARDAVYRAAQEAWNRDKAINSLVGMLSVNTRITRKEFERGVDQLELAYGLQTDELSDLVAFVENNYIEDIYYNDNLGRQLLTFKKELDSNALLNIIEDSQGTYSVKLKSLKTYIKNTPNLTPDYTLRISESF
jgi:hypothetical protein